MATAAGKNYENVQSALLPVTTTSASVTFTNSAGESDPSFSIFNSGSVTAYVAGGPGIPTAVISTATPQANCYAIGAGQTQVISFPPGTKTIAAITASGTTNLEISIGIGQ